MAQHKSPSDDQAGIASPTPPPWIHRTAAYVPERRARMLEHMARARSRPRATTASEPSHTAGTTILADACGYAVLFGIIALLFQSRVPLYLGAFLFFTDGERIELALAKIGIRLELGTIGPDIIKGFVSLFGWFALLASLKASVPAWLATWMLPDTSWSLLAGIALLFAIVEAFATRAMQHALPWFGFERRPSGLACATIKLAMALGVLALLVLLG
ncbi:MULTISPECIES: hypothetical protein [unclassified Bradyrhizobium]|jgi:hypothetical protein|uniref:hypothetical protein n=1 Tax=unclassified Bradyrhizobium TaxID=2631580 RepID=UPI00037CCABA|nr:MULTISPECIES: hypothetical protein [unclassified Bradyrhizobium]MCK1323151.1 hypothetical protein [Bradyrhizobium sp. 156]MCK1354443.1 hypothetical protein [Bradyrhizobium sp. CW7]MCK1415693.1 hypothetical protein [Bradyrhizobium sp. CW4]MCK1501429.1 hypothetical protein [Bradyrhizobium sp. 188]MCK1526099.1 hypothetical protein [Bradyrhizobium sp. 17]